MVGQISGFRPAEVVVNPCLRNKLPSSWVREMIVTMAAGSAVGIAAQHVRFRFHEGISVGPAHSYQPWETKGHVVCSGRVSLHSCTQDVSPLWPSSTHSMHYPPHSRAARLWDQLSSTPELKFKCALLSSVHLNLRMMLVTPTGRRSWVCLIQEKTLKVAIQ